MIILKTARRAERGPNPGSFAINLIKASILSGDRSNIISFNGVSIESGESTPFAYGHSGNTQVNYGTSGNILENMDYSFDITPRNLFSSNLVSSMVEWEITDDATSLIVDSDSYDPTIGPQQSSTGATHSITVPSSNLPAGDYTLSSWISVDGNDPPATINGEAGTYAYAEQVTESHSFSVVPGTITGNEQITISNLDSYYAYSTDQTFDIDITGLDSNANYQIEWRVCDYYYDIDGDWVCLLYTSPSPRD